MTPALRRFGRPLRAALATALLGAAPAAAQQAAAPAASPAAPAASALAPGPAVVVTIKLDRVLMDSALGRETGKQMERLTERLRQDFRDRELKLKEQEREIAALRSQISDSELQALANQFQQRKWHHEEDAKASEERLERSRQAALGELQRQLTPVLGEVMTRLGAGVMIDESRLVWASPTLDVTDEVIRAFDAAAKPFEVRLPGGD